jgi:hypothetical protein
MHPKAVAVLIAVLVFAAGAHAQSDAKQARQEIAPLQQDIPANIADSTGIATGQSPAAQERSRPAERTFAWPVQLGVVLVLALVAGVAITIAVKSGRRSGY